MKEFLIVLALLTINSVFAYTETLETCEVKGKLIIPSTSTKITQVDVVDADNNLMLESTPSLGKVLYNVREDKITKADQAFGSIMLGLSSTLSNYDLHAVEEITIYTHIDNKEELALSVLKLTDVNDVTMAKAVRLTNDDTFDVRLPCK